MTTTSTTTESTDNDQPSFDAVYDQLETLTDRVDELETQLERKNDRINELESTVNRTIC